MGNGGQHNNTIFLVVILFAVAVCSLPSSRNENPDIDPSENDSFHTQ
jgi:hypothetical protein